MEKRKRKFVVNVNQMSRDDTTGTVKLYWLMHRCKREVGLVGVGQMQRLVGTKKKNQNQKSSQSSPCFVVHSDPRKTSMPLLIAAIKRQQFSKKAQVDDDE